MELAWWWTDSPARRRSRRRSHGSIARQNGQLVHASLAERCSDALGGAVAVAFCNLDGEPGNLGGGVAVGSIYPAGGERKIGQGR